MKITKMRNILIFLFFIPIIANAISKTNNSIKEKLKEVNPNWGNRNYSLDHLKTKNNLNKKELIHLNLPLVENQLRKNYDKSLSVQQKKNTSHCLDLLHNYWKNGVFPQNTFHSKRTPYFIDIYGTYCAVGYLIKETGFDEVAKKINNENNYGYLRDLAVQYREIGLWAKEYGFSIDELAWIQPLYGVLTCLPYTNFSSSYDTIIKLPCISDGYIQVPDPSTWCAQLPVTATICSYQYFTQQDSLPSGSYTITVTDANNIIKNFYIELKDSLRIVMHQELITCTPNTLYNLTIDSVINGTAPFTYGVLDAYNYIINQPNSIIDSLVWYSAINMSPGYAIAQDINGCFARESFFPNQDFGFPIAFAKSTDATCQNICSGSITIDSIWNAIGPVTYYKMVNGNWIQNNSNVFDSLCVGSIYYKIEDSIGCSSNQYGSIAMGSPANYFQLNITQGNIPLCNGQPVTLNVSINGGIPPYVQQIQNWANGNMRVKITDSLGCVKDTLVHIVQPDILAIKDSVVSPICGNMAGVINISGVGGTPPYSGIGNVSLNIGNNFFTVTDANSCVATKQKYMPYYPVTITDSILSPATCVDSAIVKVSICGPAHPYSGVGIYTLPIGSNIITMQGNDGCVFYDTINISPIGGITIGVNMQTAISCFGDTAVVNVSALGGVPPYIGVGTFALPAGVHTLTVTDVNGCVEDSILTITQPALLTITHSIIQDIHCYGDSALIAISAQGGLAPYVGVGQFSLPAGVHNFNVTDTNNCTASITVSLVSPTIITYNSISYADNGAGNGSAKCNVAGGIPPYSFLWSNGGNTDSISSLVTGWYSVTITDSNGCINTDSVFVSIKYPQIITVVVDVPLYISPNPTSGNLHNQFYTKRTQTCIITLLDQLGQIVKMYQVKTIDGQNNFELSLKDIAKGAYLLKISNDEHKLHHKVVIE